MLVWRLRHGDDPTWAAEALRRVRVLVVGPVSVALPEGWARLGEQLTTDALTRAVPDAGERAGSVAGSPSWIASARRMARAAGVRRVRTDRFLGY